MTITHVIECFNELNEPKMTLDDFYDQEMIFFKLRFVVRSPYFAENVDGGHQFARKYRRLLNEIKAQFIKEHRSFFESQGLSEGPDQPLEAIAEIVADLKSRLDRSFVIPDQIELVDIELMGTWSAFHEKKETKLRLEVENKMLKEMIQQYGEID